jgi:hypothetical protein
MPAFHLEPVARKRYPVTGELPLGTQHRRSFLGRPRLRNEPDLPAGPEIRTRRLRLRRPPQLQFLGPLRIAFWKQRLAPPQSAARRLPDQCDCDRPQRLPLDSGDRAVRQHARRSEPLAHPARSNWSPRQILVTMRAEGAWERTVICPSGSRSIPDTGRCAGEIRSIVDAACRFILRHHRIRT